MIHTLHINDHNLLVQGADFIASSQGYAWFKGDAVVFDCNSEHAPIKNCRLAPQQINSRYWQQCEQSSIAINGAGMRHAADLIWRHLSELKGQHALNKVVLVVPSHYQAANLKLLLGIAKSCGLQVVGLLNKAVAALHDYSGATGECWHIDVQLHQSVCTRVSVSGDLIKSGAVEIVQNVGIQAMQDALLKAIQESFIQNDRFDPLHYAETEQQLFDQLDAVAKEVQASAKATVTVQYQDRLHRSSIDSKLWSATLAPFFEQLLSQAANSEAVFIDLNGAFENCLLPELKGTSTSILSAPADLNLVSVVSDNGVDEPLIYRTELPRADTVKAVTNVDMELGAPKNQTVKKTSPSGSDLKLSNPKPNMATHLLQLGVAVPLERAEIRTDANQLSVHDSALGNAQSLLDSGQIFIVNDDSRRIFEPNDRLGSQIADGVITVIRVI